jgi:protein O-GlcNAc transferase
MNLRDQDYGLDEKTSYFLCTAELKLGLKLLLPEDYDRIVKKDRNERKRNFYLANLLLLQDNYEEGIELLIENYRHFNCHYSLLNSAIACKNSGEFEKGINLVQPLKSLPHFKLRVNWLLGKLYSFNEESQKSIDAYFNVVNQNKNDSEAWYNMAIELLKLNRIDVALRTLIMNVNAHKCPHSANRLANFYITSKEFDLAKKFINAAISFDPQNSGYYNNLGNMFLKKGSLREAARAYSQSIKLNSKNAQPYYNLANVFRETGKLGLAVNCYSEAVALKPDYNEAWANKIYLKAQIADFSWEDDYQAFKKNCKKTSNPPPPLSLVFAEDNPMSHLEMANWWMSNISDYTSLTGQFSNVLKTSDKIIVAYVTGDSSTHAVSRLALELFRSLDRDCFSVIGATFSKLNRKDLDKFETTFDKLIDLSALSIPERILRLRGEGIDIAFDMCGHTKNACTEIFKARIAPKQINFLGQPGTMGGNSHDFIIADKVLVPTASRRYFSEEVIYLEGCYIPETNHKLARKITKVRGDYSLDEKSIVFWALHNQYKVSQPVFDCWLDILKAVDQGVLWLLEGATEQKNNLKRYAEKKHINPDRLAFTPRMDFNEYLNSFDLADLFLDTQNYTAGSTAKDAVDSGIPVISILGNSYAARMSLSVLRLKKSQYFIAQCLDEYEHTAVSWSKNLDSRGRRPVTSKTEHSKKLKYVKNFEEMLKKL